MASGWTDPRPLSPHLSVWKWHATMLTSILHRATGVAQYMGMVLIAIWLGALAMGPEAYGAVEGLLLSWFGRLVLFGFTFSILFHLANGIRYLFWDSGRGFDPKFASAISVFNIVFAVAATVGVWFAAYAL